MNSLAQDRPIRQSARPATRTLRACVVDANSDGYGAWRELAAQRGVRLEMFTSATAALRAARNEPIDLWLVNAELPGISGFELCAMLKSRSAAAPVYLVTDTYTPDQERQAWASRATLFACKTQRPELLEQWIDSQAVLNTEN